METEDFFFFSFLNNEEVLIDACLLWHATRIQNNVSLKEFNYMQKSEYECS